MKTIFYNLILACLLVPLLGFSGNSFDGRHTKEKKIKKSYNVSPTALLKIKNSYGNIDISTWDQDKIEIEVIIRTNGNDEEKVIKRLNEINIDFSHSNSIVSAVTQLKEQNSSWFSSFFGGSSNVNVEINYRIKAPVTNDMELANDYGSISLDKLEGNVTIACDYGKLLIGELLGEQNLLVFDYTRNSQIGFIKKGKIVADYSDISIEEAGTLEVIADYTDIRIKKVENIKFTGDYGSFRIDNVRNLIGNGDYLGIKLGSVYKMVELDLDYGSLSIDRIMKSMQKLKIESDYTGIKIGYDPNISFSFNIRTSYANVRGIDEPGFEVNKRQQTNTSEALEGYYRNSSGATISINSSYGNISFEN